MDPVEAARIHRPGQRLARGSSARGPDLPRPFPEPGDSTLKDHTDLRRELERLDGRGYPAYRDLTGVWAFPGFHLHLDHIQADPFAAPSRVRVTVPRERAGFPREECTPGPRSEGVAAFLAREFASLARRSQSRRGGGKGGAIRMEAPGQEVLPQTAVLVRPDGGVEARFTVGLPASGRRILGGEAAALLCSDLPELVEGALLAEAYPADAIRRHARVNEDALALRDQLRHRGLVGFVADGAVLPRRSGVDQDPLDGPGVVPFRSPDSLAVTLERPEHGPLRGMGIPAGVTLIVGGGYHGKSTLLRALERGVYNHRPGDGREWVVCDVAAVKVRAEDGRGVAGVDISPFIGRLPGGVDTRRFTTGNASGSTSQAAAISEALEAGARVLLVDEDTAATNFLIRDRRMQLLIPRAGEPITPFIDRVRWLYREHGVSAVLALGGSGDYLEVADRVVAMRDFLPSDVTEEARRIAREHPTGRVPDGEWEGEKGWTLPSRIPRPASVNPRKGRREVSVRVREEDVIEVGEERIDLSGVEQLVSLAQTRGVSQAILLARARFMDGGAAIPEILDRVSQLLEREGLDALDSRLPGDLAGFRRFELAAALNRLRSLQVLD